MPGSSSLTPLVGDVCFLCRERIKPLEPFLPALVRDRQGEIRNLPYHVLCHVELIADRVADEIGRDEGGDDDNEPDSRALGRAIGKVISELLDEED